MKFGDKTQTFILSRNTTIGDFLNEIIKTWSMRKKGKNDIILRCGETTVSEHRRRTFLGFNFGDNTTCAMSLSIRGGGKRGAKSDVSGIGYTKEEHVSNIKGTLNAVLSALIEEPISRACNDFPQDPRSEREMNFRLSQAGNSPSAQIQKDRVLSGYLCEPQPGHDLSTLCCGWTASCAKIRVVSWVWWRLR